MWAISVAAGCYIVLALLLLPSGFTQLHFPPTSVISEDLPESTETATNPPG